MSQIKIALADDQQLFRQGLGTILTGCPDFELLFDAESGRQFLDTLSAADVRPSVALLDVEMPDMDGMELLQKLRADYPDIRVLMLSVHSSERLIARLIKMGACGYLLKNCDKDELIRAVKSTFEQGIYINRIALAALQRPEAGKRVSGGFAAVNLTTREREVLRLICREYSNVEIAEQLFISPRTVDGHRNNLLLKTGSKNTAGLVLFAVKHELYDVY